VARDGGGSPVVISGSRRLAALKMMGRTTVTAAAAVRPAGAAAPLGESAYLAMVAISENLWRPRSQAETVRAYGLAADNASEGELPILLGLLGVSPKSRRARLLGEAASLPKRAMDMLAADGLDLENALEMAELGGEGLGLMLDLVERFSPSRQNRRLWTDRLRDVGRREGAGALLSFLGELLRLGPDGPGGAEAVSETIRLRRNPYLAELKRCREEALKNLALPPGLKISLDPEFEDTATTIELTVPDLGTLENFSAKLASLCGPGGIETLWGAEGSQKALRGGGANDGAPEKVRRESPARKKGPEGKTKKSRPEKGDGPGQKPDPSD
jgi:hypothetical protein